MKARDNPFRSERVDALRYRNEGFSWDGFELRLAELRGRGAVVGHRGHGKSTLLREWAARREEAGARVVFFRMREGQRFLGAGRRAICDGADLVVDGAEQLGVFGWLDLRRLARRARSLVVSLHRPGRLPTLMQCRTSPALLNDLVSELTGGGENCAGLWLRHKGNVREAFFDLYARAADREIRCCIPAGSSR